MPFKLFKKKNVKQIVVTFTEDSEGNVNTRITMDGSIGIPLAQDAIRRMSANVAFGLSKRVSEARFHASDPSKTKFIKSLTIGDIMDTKTLKY
jgi:hypothetical protein